MINEQIRDREVRVIGEDGQVIGIMSSRDALKLAKEAELDLVKIAPQAKPPVCKIMDYGKYRYELQKKDKEAKKNQKTIRVKEIKMSPTIEEHDLKVKTSQAVKFLEGGDKVKVSVRFRGRQMGHVEQGKEVLNWFFDEIKDYAQIDKPAKLEGRNMVMYVLPKSE